MAAYLVGHHHWGLQILTGGESRPSDEMLAANYLMTVAAISNWRLSSAEHAAAWRNFLQIWPDLHVVDVTAELAIAAAEFARSLELRGYDAVHCASAVELNGPEMIATAGDQRLLAAWQALGVAVLDTDRGD